MKIERINEISAFLANDLQNTKTLLEMEPAEAAKALAKGGLDVSPEELVEYGEELKKMSKETEGELDENDLENVAGGIAAATVILVGMAVGYIIGRGRPW